MSTPRNNSKPWSKADNAQLRKLAETNTPTRIIGIKMGRTPGAIESHASQEKLSLKPINQSPYNRKPGK
jgi:hypothetical protein